MKLRHSDVRMLESGNLLLFDNGDGRPALSEGSEGTLYWFRNPT